jgi:hypothetical protein
MKKDEDEQESKQNEDKNGTEDRDDGHTDTPH